MKRKNASFIVVFILNSVKQGKKGEREGKGKKKIHTVETLEAEEM